MCVASSVDTCGALTQPSPKSIDVASGSNDSEADGARSAGLVEVYGAVVADAVTWVDVTGATAELEQWLIED